LTWLFSPWQAYRCVRGESYERHKISLPNKPGRAGRRLPLPGLNFNAKTAMGRLTLNILLAFARFEREIISERTRDKRVVSREEGKFVGGMIPFGYQLNKKEHC